MIIVAHITVLIQLKVTPGIPLLETSRMKPLEMGVWC